jgi:hypothetical protein
MAAFGAGLRESAPPIAQPGRVRSGSQTGAETAPVELLVIDHVVDETPIENCRGVALLFLAGALAAQTAKSEANRTIRGVVKDSGISHAGCFRHRAAVARGTPEQWQNDREHDIPIRGRR